MNTIYIVTFHLTPFGRTNLSSVIKHFFHFVDQVNRLPNKAEVFESLSKNSKFGFLFNVKSQFVDFSNVEQDLMQRVSDMSETI